MSQFSSLNKFSAKHGRFTVATAVGNLLPSLPIAGMVNIPTWAFNNLPLSIGSSEPLESLTGLGSQPTLDLSKPSLGLFLTQQKLQSRGSMLIQLSENKASVCEAVPQFSISTAPQIHDSGLSMGVNTYAGTWGSRSPISASTVGNRLAHIHSHLTSDLNQF